MTRSSVIRWRCRICGYIHTGERPPYRCPVCQAPAKMFEAIPLEPDDGPTLE